MPKIDGIELSEDEVELAEALGLEDYIEESEEDMGDREYHEFEDRQLVDEMMKGQNDKVS